MIKLTVQEEIFLNMIKPTIISESSKYKISPSIIASLAIVESNWGTNRLFSFSRNVFHLRVDDNWFGPCYNDQNQTTYKRKSDCDIIGAILYRVYNRYEDSIIDFISYLKNDRRSKNGPLRYQSIFDCIDYKEFLDKLTRSGFMQSYLNKNDDINYLQNLLSIVEKYELYLWDNSIKETIKMEEDMSNKKNKNRVMVAPLNLQPIQNTNSIIEEDNTLVGAEESIELEQPIEELETKAETLETFSHIYRVRLDWDKPDTQIFASPKYEDAKKEALAHEGYKIYIDDDGSLFEDPWVKEEIIIEEPKRDSRIKDIIRPVPGSIINLNKAPLYKTAIARYPEREISGTFIFYDRTISHDRVKIITKDNYTNNYNVRNILGWINIKEK